MKRTIKLSETELKQIIGRALKENAFDVYGAAVDKHEMDRGFRNRYGIGQDWPHYDSEEYENGIWVDDEGRAWTVFAGDNRATCIDCEKEYNFDDDSLGEAISRALRKYL